MSLNGVKLKERFFLLETGFCVAGACQAVKATSTTGSAEAAANKCLSFRNVRNATITISPGSVEAVARGQQIRVTVSAPLGGNSPFIGRIIANRTLSASVSVSPATITDQTRELTIRIRTPLDRGLFGPVRFFRGKSLDRSLTMKREGT